MPRRSIIVTLIVLAVTAHSAASLARTAELQRNPEGTGRLAIPFEAPDGHSMIVTMNTSGGDRRVLTRCPT